MLPGSGLAMPGSCCWFKRIPNWDICSNAAIRSIMLLNCGARPVLPLVAPLLPACVGLLHVLRGQVCWNSGTDVGGARPLRDIGDAPGGGNTWWCWYCARCPSRETWLHRIKSICDLRDLQMLTKQGHKFEDCRYDIRYQRRLGDIFPHAVNLLQGETKS
jgi:hypothetical protein